MLVMKTFYLAYTIAIRRYIPTSLNNFGITFTALIGCKLTNNQPEKTLLRMRNQISSVELLNPQQDIIEFVSSSALKTNMHRVWFEIHPEKLFQRLRWLFFVALCNFYHLSHSHKFIKQITCCSLYFSCLHCVL